MLVREVDSAHFRRELIDGQALILRGAVADWIACRTWTPQRFQALAGDIEVTVKGFGSNGPVSSEMRIAEFAARLLDGAWTHPLYLHDVPIFLLAPELLADVGTLPAGILPRWYAREWWRFAQFFLGPDRAVTPLHFDSLRTFNIFFHLRGHKTFTLIRWRDRDKCQRRGWRWFDLDPESADFPDLCAARGILHTRVTLGPGDVLLMPPGMLHHVRSSGITVSFNIDFHTCASAVASLLMSAGRSPRLNLKYTGAALAAQIGLLPGYAARVYAPYLNYVS